MNIRIDKGVPLPRRGNKSRWDDLPWEKLEIGDSFVLESTTSSYLKKAAEKKGIKIAIRSARISRIIKGVPIAAAFRIWRIE